MEVDGGGAAADADGAAASPPGSVDTVRIPSLEAAAIDFPGYIRNPDRALAALGGAAEAAAVLDARSAVMKLWLRPEDPLSHPLFGERRRTRALLLRVARRRSAPPDAPLSVSLAAVVRSGYRFTGLADFQYLPVDHKTATRSFASLPEKNRPDAAEVYRRPQPFLLVPPLFSRTDVPLEFVFRDDGADRDAAAAGEEGMRVISFYEPDIPQPLANPLAKITTGAAAAAAAGTIAGRSQRQQQGGEGGEQGAGDEEMGREGADAAAAAAAAAAGRLRELVEGLQGRLRGRPVWPPAQLTKGLAEGVGADQVEAAVAALCYQFKTGPWKQQLVRRGYDPRTDKEARSYQAVSYRCPAEWYDRVKQARASGITLQEPTFEELHSFTGMPLSRTTQLILADVSRHDEMTAQLLRTVPWPDRAGEAYGWCFRNGQLQLANAVARRYAQLIEEGYEPQPAPPAADGADTAAGTAAPGTAAAGAAAAAAGARPMPMEVDGEGEDRGEAAAAAAARRAREAATAAGGSGGLPLRSESEAAADAAAILPGALMDGLVREMEAAPGEVQAWLSEQARLAEEAAAESPTVRRRGGGISDGGSQPEGSESEGASASDWGDSEAE